MTTPSDQDDSITRQATRAIELGLDPLTYVTPLSRNSKGQLAGQLIPISKERRSDPSIGRDARRLIEFAAPTWASFFADALKDGSVSPDLLNRWAQTSDIPALESAAKKLVLHEARPQVMVEDYNWISNYAGVSGNEWRAIQSLNDDEFASLMGENFYPATADGAFQKAWRTKLPADLRYAVLKNAGFVDEIHLGGGIALNAIVPVKSIPWVHDLLFDASMDPGKRRHLKENVPLQVEIFLDIKQHGAAPVIRLAPDRKFYCPTDDDDAVEAFFESYLRFNLRDAENASVVLREVVSALHARWHKQVNTETMGEWSPKFPDDESGEEGYDDERQNVQRP